MNIQKLTLGLYQTNTYLLANDTEAVVIDPGYEADTILDALAGKTLKAILLTHGHFDHVGAVKELVAETGCDVYIHAAESTMPPMVTAGPLYFTHTYDEGDTIAVGDLTLEVMATPGHSEGGVTLRCGNALFCGDTLFAGSMGRTDFPGGSEKTIMKSLKRLGELSGNFLVYPGHMEPSELDRERRVNPYLLHAMKTM